MKTRVIAGLCMAPLLLIIYFGGLPLTIAAALIALMGIKEFYDGWRALGVNPSLYIAYAMIIILYAMHLIIGFNPMFLCAWLFVAITVAMIYGWDMTKRGPYDAMATVLGIVYVVFFSYHIVLIDQTPFRLFTWLVVIAAFGSDIMAYFTGYLIGKHKLAPVLSPKKTIEGAVGGLVGAALFCGLFTYFVMPEYMIHAVIIGFIGGAFSQAGDLTASAFKRKMGVKDYGNLIPGHGGIMDRFDSIIFVAPLVYYYIALVLMK